MSMFFRHDHDYHERNIFLKKATKQNPLAYLPSRQDDKEHLKQR